MKHYFIFIYNLPEEDNFLHDYIFTNIKTFFPNAKRKGQNTIEFSYPKTVNDPFTVKDSIGEMLRENLSSLNIDYKFTLYLLEDHEISVVKEAAYSYSNLNRNNP